MAEFYEVITLFDEFRQHFKSATGQKVRQDEETRIEFECSGIKMMDSLQARRMLTVNEADVGRSQIITEHRWGNLSRPYYNVYPSVAKLLIESTVTRTQSQQIDLGLLPYMPFVLRMPRVNNPLKVVNGDSVQSDVEYIMIDRFIKPFKIDGLKLNVNVARPVINIWFHSGERVEKDFMDTIQEGKVSSFEFIEMQDGKTLEECLDRSRLVSRSNIPEEMSSKEELLNVLKVTFGVILLSQDSELVNPDVLSKYREKYRETNDEKYVEKSIRKGKVGFNIGKEFEEKRKTDPSWRNPHMCHFRVGPGRKNIIYKLRRGAFVHRKIIKKVPTGFEGKENENGLS